MIKHVRVIKFSLLMAALALLSGCFGTFPTTRTVYSYNKDVKNTLPEDSPKRKRFQTFVMWVFIPIYGGATFADMWFFNTMEYWEGRTPGPTANPRVGDTTTAMAPAADGRQAK